MDVIVVGVDGSPGSRAALRYALRQARTSGAPVRVVEAWQVPAPAYEGPVDVDDLSLDLGDAAAETIEDALAAVSDVVDGVTVERTVREGDAGLAPRW